MTPNVESRHIWAHTEPQKAANSPSEHINSTTLTMHETIAILMQRSCENSGESCEDLIGATWEIYASKNLTGIQQGENKALH